VLDDATVAHHVRIGWRLPVTAAARLAAGLDPDARAYELHTVAGARYFAKVRVEPGGPAVALVPRYLRRRGRTAIVAPLDTAAGEPWLDVAGHRLLVYPFVAGSSAWQTGLTDAQWLEYAEFLAALHGTAVPPDLAAHVGEERFDPPSLGRLAETAARIGEPIATPTPAQRELVALWRRDARRIAELAARTAELRDLARTNPPPNVLCHTDIHTGNILVDPAGRLSIVDWDAPLLAPRERDLMYVLGGPWSDKPVTPHQERLFWRGYGAYDVDRAVLAYYLCERVIDDVEQFARRILADDADGVDEPTRQTDLHWLRATLAPADLGLRYSP
jgi:spectinomycin phosphotransferase